MASLTSDTEKQTPVGNSDRIEIQTSTLGRPWFFPSLKKGEGFCLFQEGPTFPHFECFGQPITLSFHLTKLEEDVPNTIVSNYYTMACLWQEIKMNVTFILLVSCIFPSKSIMDGKLLMGCCYAPEPGIAVPNKLTLE